MANPFAIRPLGGIDLGQTLTSGVQGYRQQQALEQQQAQQAQMKDLMTRASTGDVTAMNELWATNPQLANIYQQRQQQIGQEQAEAMREPTIRFLMGYKSADPQQRQAMMQQAIQDPTIDFDEEDALAIQQSPEILEFGLRSLMGDSYGEIYAQPKEVEIAPQVFGKYTPESIQAYKQTGDYSQLKPVGEKPQTQKQKEMSDLKRQEQELKVEKAKQEKLKRQMEIAQKKQDTQKAKALELEEATAAIANIDDLLATTDDETIEDNLDLIFGARESLYPDVLRSQKGRNMQIKRDMVVANLKLAAAGKLKGQGTVTDNERTMLAEAATLLNNESISPELARKELERVRGVFNKVVAGQSAELVTVANETDYANLAPGTKYIYQGVEYVKGQ